MQNDNVTTPLKLKEIKEGKKKKETSSVSQLLFTAPTSLVKSLTTLWHPNRQSYFVLFFFFQLRKVSVRIILNLSKITIYLPTWEDDENSKKENLEYSIQKQF